MRKCIPISFLPTAPKYYLRHKNLLYYSSVYCHNLDLQLQDFCNFYGLEPIIRLKIKNYIDKTKTII